VYQLVNKDTDNTNVILKKHCYRTLQNYQITNFGCVNKLSSELSLQTDVSKTYSCIGLGPQSFVISLIKIKLE